METGWNVELRATVPSSSCEGLGVRVAVQPSETFVVNIKASIKVGSAWRDFGEMKEVELGRTAWSASADEELCAIIRGKPDFLQDIAQWLRRYEPFSTVVLGFLSALVILLIGAFIRSRVQRSE